MIQRKYFLYVFIYFLFVILSNNLTSCKAISQGKRLAECQFRATTRQDFSAAGVRLPDNFQDISQLNFLDVATLTAAFTRGGEFPLTFTQNIEIQNPSTQLAALDRVEWILVLDKTDLTQGVIDQRIEVPANGTTTMPVKLRIDLRKVLNSDSAESFLNLVKNLLKQGDSPTTLKLKIKPSFRIAGALVPYPGYISLRQEFGSN